MDKQRTSVDTTEFVVEPEYFQLNEEGSCWKGILKYSACFTSLEHTIRNPQNATSLQQTLRTWTTPTHPQTFRSVAPTKSLDEADDTGPTPPHGRQLHDAAVLVPVIRNKTSPLPPTELHTSHLSSHPVFVDRHHAGQLYQTATNLRQQGLELWE